MRIICNREQLLDSFGIVAAIIPARTPKPILQNVKLSVDSDGQGWVQSTDLEVGIRHRLLGIQAEGEGQLLLPSGRFGSILRMCPEDSVEIEPTRENVQVTCGRSEFVLPQEDPALFPEIPRFTAEDFHEVSALDLKKLIKRTIFATDAESTRFALGGVLFEFGEGSVITVATDGRRLAKMMGSVVAAKAVGGERPPCIMPIKVLRLIDRSLDDDDPPVHILADRNSVTLRTERAEIWSRLVEGRFPRYQDVFRDDYTTRVKVSAGVLLSAVQRASIVTSEESHGVDFAFKGGNLALASQTANIGSSSVEIETKQDGPGTTLAIDPRYLVDAMKSLSPADEVAIELTNDKGAVVFRVDDGFVYVVMPLARDASAA